MRQLNNKGQVTDDVRSGKYFFFRITQLIGLHLAMNHGYYFGTLLATREPCIYFIIIV